MVKEWAQLGPGGRWAGALWRRGGELPTESLIAGGPKIPRFRRPAGDAVEAAPGAEEPTTARGRKRTGGGRRERGAGSPGEGGGP